VQNKSLIFILSCVFLTPLVAAQSVNESLDGAGVNTIEIEVVRGNVDIQGTDESSISVKGSLDPLTENFVFERVNNTVELRVELPPNNRNRGRAGSNLMIRVPQSVLVRFNGVATKANFENLTSGIDAVTVSGDIAAKNIQQDIRINSVSGNIDLRDSTGKVEVSTVSGDFNAQVDAQEVDISTISADVDFVSTEFESLYATSVSGDVYVRGNVKANGEVKMSSVSGEVVLETSKNLSARVSLQTGPGGDIENSVTNHKPETSFINDKSLSFKSGSGDARINMSTVSGTIRMKGK